MRGCVAIDSTGKAVGMFDSIKDAALQMGLLPDRVRKAIVLKQIVDNLKWMYEEDYIPYLEKGKTEKLAWDKKSQKAKRPMKFDVKLQMRATKERNKEYRKEVIGNTFRRFAKYHLLFLQELREAFLERGDFGIRPEMLADYYENIRDKEIALLVSVMLPMKSSCYETALRFHSFMGEHPWEWFKNRLFSAERGWTYVERNRVVPFLNEWWTECFGQGGYSSLGECIKNVSERDGISFLEMMERTKKVSLLRLGLLLLVFSRCDGLGQGLWNIDRKDVTIPVRGPLIAFMETWLPNCLKYGSYDECLELFGMDSVDFYYTFLAYEELKKVQPKECSRYASFYNEAYSHHVIYKPSHWAVRLPEIDFTPRIVE